MSLTNPLGGTGRKNRPSRQTCRAMRGRIVTMTLGQHVAALDVRCVPAIGLELVLLINGELRRGRVFRRNQPQEMDPGHRRYCGVVARAGMASRA
jgi:hypothetical protein